MLPPVRGVRPGHHYGRRLLRGPGRPCEGRSRSASGLRQIRSADPPRSAGHRSCSRSAGRAGGIDNDLRHRVGAGDHGQVPGVDIGDVGARALSHEGQFGGRDDPVGGADHGPGRDGLLGRWPGRLGERAGRWRPLGDGDDRGLGGGQAAGEAAGHHVWLDVEVDVAGGPPG